jgi:tetratricopeptide (TPR) repeat protein
MSISIGQRIGHYEVVEPLGSGGMGKVYVARDVRLGRQVALKLLRHQASQDPTLVKRFLREAQAASALNHPNIVTIYESGEDEGGYFIAMELIHGQTLRAMMGPQPTLESFLQLSVQMARALSVAHAAAIIHRDIKPENIMVREDGYVKILDFGLAHQELNDTLSSAITQFATIPGTVIGSLRYMSPEQARGEKLAVSTDIFSLGIVFYELVTGRHPFGESYLSVLEAILNHQPVPPSHINPDISGTLEALILRMLEKNPRARPASTEVESILTEPADRDSLSVRKMHIAERLTVGRERERSELQLAFDSVVGGKGILISVEGEAGIGKSTLVEQFLGEVQGANAALIGRGRSSQRLEGTEAYVPVLEAMEDLLHGAHGGAMARVMKLLAPTWYMQVASLPSGESGVAELISAAHAVSSERIRRELSGFFQEACRLWPVVLFFEDLHWADVSTVDLLGYLASRFSDMRLLIVVTSRREELLSSKHPFLRIKQDLQARGLCREIALDFLTQNDLQSYLDQQFQGHAFPPEFPALVHAKTEGNPLFMVDVLRYLRDRKVLVHVDKRWSLVESLPDIERQLPESVRGMIERKIDMLDENARRLLVAGSVQGYEFHAVVLARVLNLDSADVEDRLDELDRIHGLIRNVREEEFADGTITLRFRFVHVLYQNALYASLKPARRASLSAAVARQLEQFYKNHTTEIASELAVLFESAREFDRAAEYFLRAAEKAGEVFAYQESILLARRGLHMIRLLDKTPDRVHRELLLRFALGHGLAPTKGFGDAELQKNYRIARQLAQDVDIGPKISTVLTGLLGFFVARMELDTARELANQLMELAQKSGDALVWARAHHGLGVIAYFADELQSSIEHFERSLSYYDPAQHHQHIRLYDIDSSIVSKSMVGRCQQSLGYPDRAFNTVTDAVQYAQSLSHPPSHAWALFFAAIVYISRPDTGKDWEATNMLIAISTEHGLPYWKIHGLGIRGLLLCREGKFDEGIPTLQRAIAGLRTGGNQASLPFFIGLLAQALQGQRKLVEALEVVDQAFDNTLRILSAADLYRIKGQILAGLGRREEADEWFEKAVTTTRNQNARMHELQALTSWLRGCSESRRSEVRQMLTNVYDMFTEGFETVELKAAKALLGRGIES